MKSVDDIKIDALKSNEYYNKILEKVKESIKEKVLSMNTKDEQLKYISEEKTRYTLLMNSNKSYSLIALILGICGLVSTILLTVLKDNIVFFIFWLISLAVLFGAVGVYAVFAVNGTNVKCSIVLMAYEDIEEKLKNGIISSEDSNKADLQVMMKSIRESVDAIQGQLKMIYALQKEGKHRSRTN